MSVWTHVCGVIRADSIQGIMPAPDFTKLIGKTVSYDDPRSDWDACTVPHGSEGSLQYDVWTNPEKSNLAAYTISIFGDLRDYDESHSVIKWFDEVCARFKMVRQAVITVETEGQEPVTKTYKAED